MRSLRPLATLSAALALSACTPAIPSDHSVLVMERHVREGEFYEVPGWGNVGANHQESLVCKYIDTRGERWRVYWYSANGVLGRDRCPSILNEDGTPREAR